MEQGRESNLQLNDGARTVPDSKEQGRRRIHQDKSSGQSQACIYYVILIGFIVTVIVYFAEQSQQNVVATPSSSHM